MALGDCITEPLKEFNYIYKDAFKENCQKMIDSITSKANVDVSANREIVKKHKEKQEELKNTGKSLKKFKILRTLILIFAIFSLTFGAVMLLMGVLSDDLSVIQILISCLLLVAGVILLVLNYTVLKKKIKSINEIGNKLQHQDNELLETAYNQMSKLNNLYTSDIMPKLIEQTTPQIKLDRYFDMKKYDLMVNKYGYKESLSKDESTLMLLSGSISGNPFLLRRTLNNYMGTKTYEGTLNISWSETDHDGNRITRSEVLVATVQKPYPYYYKDTQLIYGNEAAEDLCFSRKSCGLDFNKMSEKDLNKYIEKKSKKLDKIENKALTDDDETTNYQKMSDDKFEALFNCTNRTNEMQFRLLFTPLAQQNMLQLITTPQPYGDDFTFIKQNCVNIIQSSHSQNFNYSTDPTIYRDFDFDKSVNDFNNYNFNFFQGLYFDLAPLLSIPLYSQHKPHEYIYQLEYDKHFPMYQSEVMANSFNASTFKPEDCVTGTILKTEFMEKNLNADKVKVTSFGFRAEDRVEYVSKMGGDGYIHEVPVYYKEYIPVQREEYMELFENNEDELEFKNMANNNDAFSKFLNSNTKGSIIQLNGLLSFVLNSLDYNSDNQKTLNEQIKQIMHKEDK